MAKKSKRDLTREEQLARGPVDLPFLMLVLMLLGIGLVMMLSASSAPALYSKSANYDPLYYFKRQAIFAVLGLVAMYFVSRMNYQRWRGLSIVVLGLAFVMLLLVFTPLGVDINHARRWINLRFTTFQPSEMAKLAVVLFFSARLCKRRDGVTKFRKPLPQPFQGIRALLDRVGLWEFIPYGVILLLIALLLHFEPHNSAIILIFLAGASVMWAAGMRWYWFLLGGGAVGIFMWLKLSSGGYTSSRIDMWHNPWADPSDAGYQIVQSLYAIGSGGLLGLGLGNSRQKHLFLPEVGNDYIFSIVCEELGFIGAVIILLLFALLIIRGYWLALHARDRFGSLVVVGITTLLAIQVIFNVAVVTNLIPSTGISLPFFSYGGTALMMQLGEMGIVLSVSRQIQAPRQTT